MAPTEKNKGKDLIYPWLRDAKEYDFSDIKDGIRLHLNESPYSPPDFIMDAIKAYLSKGNRYQHPDLVNRFREVAAEYNKVEPENILPTQGGDGALRLVFYNLSQPGDKIVINYPSYSMYTVYSSLRGLKTVKINLREKGEWWEEDIEKIINEVSDARIVAIDDPNNPTGSPMLKGNENLIRTIAESTHGILLLDEAYFEFAGYTATKLVNSLDNLIILRTLSKAFSMASYRVGYLIGNSEIISTLRKTTTPFDVSLPSMIAGTVALENPSYAREIAAQISGLRDQVYQKMKDMGINVFKSVTNFLFFYYPLDLLKPFMDRGIAIRNPLDKFYRVTIGTPQDCEIFLRSLGEIIENSNTK
ncbi:aminotransferase class I/II-fold pyridoxal phosphate-dependent enzyme [Candidatus Acidianus copahuensis]|nr:aminotransferase class I/II-fold pyridoxal phosphate-dependent enzyme [Candidatus Acidianus copahuensis]